MLASNLKVAVRGQSLSKEPSAGACIASVQRPKPTGSLEIPPAPGLEVCGFCHGEGRREARKKVAVVLAIGHALRAHEALGRPDSLPGFLEVVHRLYENGLFVGHHRSIRTVSSDHSAVSPSPRAEYERKRKVKRA